MEPETRERPEEHNGIQLRQLQEGGQPHRERRPRPLQEGLQGQGRKGTHSSTGKGKPNITSIHLIAKTLKFRLFEVFFLLSNFANTPESNGHTWPQKLPYLPYMSLGFLRIS